MEYGYGRNHTVLFIHNIVSLSTAHCLLQLERGYDRQREVETQLHQKETKLVAIETELKHVNKSLTQMQTERSEMKLQAERLNQEIRSLACLNSSLEQRLKGEQSDVIISNKPQFNTFYHPSHSINLILDFQLYFMG